jgi:phosphatidate cytidylyltransferase
MKRNRVLVGTIVSLAVVAVLAIDHEWLHGLLSAAMLSALAFMAAWELAAILEAAGLATYQRLTATFAFLVVIVPAILIYCRCPINSIAVQTGLIFGFVVLAFGVAMRRNQPLPGAKAVASGTFALVYVGFALSIFVPLRELKGVGEALVFMVLGCAKIGDMAAYFVGTRLGKHKMAPLLSPKKTIEGALGGVAASVAVGAVVWFYVNHLTSVYSDAYMHQKASLWVFLTWAAIINVAGQFGDLAESLVKRAADVKDSSVAFGKMGGILDVVDSLLLSVPVAYILALLGGFGVR